MSMPIQIDGEVFLNTVEAMQHLGVSRPTLDGLVADGKLKRFKQGIRKLYYFKQSDLDKILSMREDDK